MSLSRSDVVDALTLRDGWAVLSIHHFESWDELEDPDELLRRKLETYFDFVESPRFQEKMHRRPSRVELISVETVPATVLEVCHALGVEVHEGE